MFASSEALMVKDPIPDFFLNEEDSHSAADIQRMASDVMPHS